MCGRCGTAGEVGSWWLLPGLMGIGAAKVGALRLGEGAADQLRGEVRQAVAERCDLAARQLASEAEQSGPGQ